MSVRTLAHVAVTGPPAWHCAPRERRGCSITTASLRMGRAAARWWTLRAEGSSACTSRRECPRTAASEESRSPCPISPTHFLSDASRSTWASAERLNSVTEFRGVVRKSTGISPTRTARSRRAGTPLVSPPACHAGGRGSSPVGPAKRSSQADKSRWPGGGAALGAPTARRHGAEGGCCKLRVIALDGEERLDGAKLDTRQLPASLSRGVYDPLRAAR
jgi:hypothetical protein